MWCKVRNIFNKPAQLPTIEDRNEVWRIYFSFRINKQSHINYIEVSKNTFRVTYENKKPVMSPGLRGTFDDSGVMPSCIIGNILYYTGWNQRVGVPYSHAIGIAKFNEDKNIFERISTGPTLDRNPWVPFLANSPCVIDDCMWFCNGTGWIDDFPTYGIALAIELNHSWYVEPEFVLNQPGMAYSRPCVQNDIIYYAKRNNTINYSIYKFQDGLEEEILPPTQNSIWDSDMTCYPYVTENTMFYNGNGYGESGIGYAERI